MSYTKKQKELRKRITTITLKQQQELNELYKGSINNLTVELGKVRPGSLEARVKKDLRNRLSLEQKRLHKEIQSKLKQGIELSSKETLRDHENTLNDILKKARLKTLPEYSLNKLHPNITKDIISGNLYKDNKTLSRRIWETSKQFEKDIQYVINQGLVEQKSYTSLAKDLKIYLKPPNMRNNDWKVSYPHLKNRPIDYRAKRLARTAINHSYQTATIQGSMSNPYIDGIRWHSALIHGRTCELCRSRHNTVYDKDKVPIDHPNGLCTMLPEITKSLDEIGDELGRWARGEESSKMLDRWYEKYGRELGVKM